MIECIITSSVLIVIITTIRILFREKISRRLQYALWGLVLLRLFLPFSLFDSPFSVMNVLPDRILNVKQSVSTPFIRDISNAESMSINYFGNIELFENKAVTTAPTKTKTLSDSLIIIWIIGSIVIGLWFICINYLFYIRLLKTRSLYNSLSCKLPIYYTESLASPCLFGIFHPAIYLTKKAIEENSMSHVLTHELCHHGHRDHIWSVLRGFCLSLWWWNPLVWLAAILSREDAELACDEAVIEMIGNENRLAYGHTLVDLIAVSKSPNSLMHSATTMNSGKRAMKNRLNMIIKNPKNFVPAMIIVLTIAVIGILTTFTGFYEKQDFSMLNIKNLANFSYKRDTANNIPQTNSFESSDLDASITAAILNENSGSYTNGDFKTESHIILKTIEDEDFTIVYTIVLYQEFDFTDSSLKDVAGSHVPVAITFHRNATGLYELLEYWTPEDGSYYLPSLKEKFPADLVSRAMDTQVYIIPQMQACYTKAAQYFGIDTHTEIDKLFKTILTSPSQMSNPNAYIEAHPLEFRELLYYGDNTLRYVFTKFLEGGQTGLEGHIMLSAMNVLIGDESLEISQAKSPQEWFDAWKEKIISIHNQSSLEMEKDMPKAYILLQMLEE